MKPVQSTTPQPALSAALTRILSFVGMGVYREKGSTSRPGWAGTPTTPRFRNGKRRHIIMPCAMQRKEGLTCEESKTLFRQFRADKTKRDVVRSMLGEKYYVAWNGSRE